MEKITVLIPVFNREKYIATCLDSICKQIYDNLEILIYDDGSTDSTVSIIKRIKDSRIRLIEGGKNKGPTEARNILLNECTTRIACWQDSDDISNIYRIEQQYKLISENSKYLVATRHMRFKEKSIDSVKYLEEPKEKGEGHSFASIMFEVNKKIKFNKENIVGGEDTRWVKTMLANKHKHVIITKCLYYIRLHSERITENKKAIRQFVRENPDIDRNTSYEDLLKLKNKTK